MRGEEERGGERNREEQGGTERRREEGRGRESEKEEERGRRRRRQEKTVGKGEIIEIFGKHGNTHARFSIHARRTHTHYTSHANKPLT